MKDVIGDLGIDLDDSQLGDLVNQANKKEEKKDADKKEELNQNDPNDINPDPFDEKKKAENEAKKRDLQ